MPDPLVITVEEVRDELPGYGLAEAISQLGSPSKVERMILADIRRAQSWVEMHAQTHLIQQVIRSRPAGTKEDSTPYVKGVDYDYEEDRYTWFPDDWDGFSRLVVRKTPVQSVQSVAVKYGQSEVKPVLLFPEAWVVADHLRGVINIQPIVAIGAATASSMVLLPILSGDFARRDQNIPLIVDVCYTAGYLPKDFDAEVDSPRDANPDQDVTPLLEAVKYRAASRLLNRLNTGNAGDAGTVSVDGSSESIIPGRFEKEVARYSEDALELVKAHVDLTRGPSIELL